MELKELLTQYKGVKQQKWNKNQARPVYMSFNDKGIEEFNRIYKTCKKSWLGTIVRTPSGGIKVGKLWNWFAWDVKVSKTGVTITVCYRPYLYMFKITGAISAELKMSGSQAFKIFKDELEKDGIDLSDYAISKEEGLKCKEQLDGKVLIEMKDLILNKELKNVNHIDFHNSYPAGLINTHPEFKTTVERLYKARKEHPENKEILNYSIGFMQSAHCKYHFAELARDAILDNFNRINSLADKLRKTGRRILGFNTDGIWYQGSVYHGKGEGPDIGMWENDHINCLFRAKSSGSYEYIENDEYHAVVRGIPNETKINWKWGSIYEECAQPLEYKWDEIKGVIKYEKI